MVKVTICLGFAHQQAIIEQEAPDGATVEQVLALASAPLDAFDASWRDYSYAIFGKAVQGTQRVSNADQLELLRPLIADPNLARQRRVEAKRKQLGRNAWRRNSRRLAGKIEGGPGA
jgi:uncharacterized protein